MFVPTVKKQQARARIAARKAQWAAANRSDQNEVERQEIHEARAIDRGLILFN